MSEADPGRRARRARPDGHRGRAGRSTPPRTSSWSRWSTTGDWLFNVADAGAEVVVDFTTPDVGDGQPALVHRPGHQRGRRHHRLHRRARCDRSGAWLAHKPELGVIVAPNFARRRGADDGVRGPGGAATSSRSRSSRCTTRTRSTRPAAPRPAPPSWSPRRGPRPGSARCRTRPRTELAGARGADVDGVRVHSVRAGRAGRAPGGAARHGGRDADHPARLVRPEVVHAGRAARGPGGRAAARPDGRPRPAARLAVHCPLVGGYFV